MRGDNQVISEARTGVRLEDAKPMINKVECPLGHCSESFTYVGLVVGLHTEVEEAGVMWL